MSLEFLVAVFCITFFLSFGVQAIFYLWYLKHNQDFLKKYQHVFQYTSGIIGDGILVPLINVFAVMTLFSVEVEVSIYAILFVISCGVLTTFIFHYGQQYFRLTNWTMPSVGKWNTLGTYHSFFMLGESSFLSFVLFEFLNSRSLSYLPTSPMKNGLLVLFIFAATFVYDYRNSLFKKVLKMFFNTFRTRINYLLSKIPDLV